MKVASEYSSVEYVGRSTVTQPSRHGSPLKKSVFRSTVRLGFLLRIGTFDFTSRDKLV